MCDSGKVSLILLSIFLVVAAANSAGPTQENDGGTIRGSANSSVGRPTAIIEPGIEGAGGAGQTAVSARRSVHNTPVRPGLSSGSADSQAQRRLGGLLDSPIGPPRQIARDGVYIWRDPDGLWTMFWRRREPLTISATLRAERPIVIEAIAGDAIQATQPTPTELEIVDNSVSRCGVVQFRSDDSTIEFEILINATNDPSRIFLGSRQRMPSSHDFSLGDRPRYDREGPIEDDFNPPSPFGSGGGQAKEAARDPGPSDRRQP